jgi:hypothetical protein
MGEVVEKITLVNAIDAGMRNPKTFGFLFRRQDPRIFNKVSCCVEFGIADM